MKNLKKVLVCIALVACLSVGAMGCNSTSDGNDNASTDVSTSDSASVDNNQTQETDAEGNVVTSTNNTSNDEVQQTVALTDANGNEVTDADGNVVTQIVVNNDNDNNNNKETQTDADGNTIPNNTVTDSKGNAVTETDSSGNNVVVTDSNDNNNSNSNDDDSIYFAKNRYSNFIWMSNDASNKCESGGVVEVEFKILDDAKAGTYPIELNYIELYDSNEAEVSCTVQNGSITVGQTASVSEQGAASSGVNYRMDTATAQPGDVVKLKISLDNNTGIAVTRVEFKYDNKALEVQSISPTGAFANEIVDCGMLNAEKSVVK